jgi:ATP-binding cassette, subfamily B, bacterial IrtA/YbtP
MATEYSFQQQIAGPWDLTVPVRGKIYLAIALSVVNALSNLLAIAAIPLLAEALLQQPQSAWQWSIAIAIATGISLLTRVLSFQASHLAAYRLENILRTTLSSHLATLPLGFTQTVRSGALKKILQDDVSSLHGFVADILPLFARAYTVPVVTLPLLFFVDWRLALASISLLPIGLGSMSLAMKDYAQKRQEYDLANESINAAVVEFVQGMQVVRTFDDGTSSFNRYQKSLDTFSQKVREWTEATIVAGRVGLLLFESLPALVVVMAVGTYSIVYGGLKIPTFLLFMLLAANLNAALKPLLLLTSFINQAKVSALRIGDILAEPSLPQPREEEIPRDSSIVFQNVSFSYNKERQILQNIDLDLPADSMTAIVGSSGGGKSTLIRLILRFWDVDSGAILVGGVDVRSMTADTLMSRISFVFQEPFLVNDSIKVNISLGKPTATEDEITAAAKSACTHDFIINLPQGYDTIVGERGVRLSGGEKQRITIARAILQDNPIIILDEAMAFADPENELLIQQSIAALTKNKTLIIVAHRLTNIQSADLIVVLYRGKVAEKGNHEQLLELNGLYAKLWKLSATTRTWHLESRSRAIS